MAIDYVLAHPCPVRQQIPEAKLRVMVKYRATAMFGIEELRKQSPDADLETISASWTVHMSVTHLDGTVRDTPVTLAQMLALVKPLDEQMQHCTACRANVAAREFGCMGKVNYPVSQEAEEWLLSRLTPDDKSPSLALLFKFLTDLDIDGAPVDRNRARRTVFEADKPATRTWGGWFRRKTLSSSQVLHMLAYSGTIGPEQARLYTKLLDLSSILSQPHPRSDVVEQFKTLACAIVMAGRLDATLEVDA